MKWICPPPLALGDRIAVVAPAGPALRELLFPGLGWLRERFQVEVTPAILSRENYLAGTDARRSREVGNAFRSPHVKAVIAARGGYGTMRILDELPWDALQAAPKWIVGFSDITSIHIECWRRSIASIHGANVTGIFGAHPQERFDWLQALEHPHAPRVWNGLEMPARTAVRGPIVGGNLALLETMAAAGRLAIPKGAIVLLEDVTEKPYRLDRMLTSLILGGHFKNAAALIFGSFTECHPGPDGRTADDVLRERARMKGLTVAFGAPFGHGNVNRPFTIGATGELAEGRLVMKLPGN